MAAGGGADAGHGETVDADDRVRVPGPGRSESCQVLEEPVVRRPGGQGEVEDELGPRIRGAAAPHQVEEAGAEGVPPIRSHLEAGRTPVAAMPLEEVVAGGEGPGEVVAGRGPARGPQAVLQLGGHHRGPTPLLHEPGGDETHDAGRPRPPDQGGRGVGIGPGKGRASLVERRAGDVPAGRVGGLEHTGKSTGLVGGRRQQEVGRVARLPHPAGGVEARGDVEGDRLEADRCRLHARGREEGGDAGSWRRAHPVEAESRDRTILPEDRGDVGHGADGGEVGQLGGRDGRRDPGKPLQEKSGHLESHPTAGEAAVRIRGIESMRIDKGRGGRWRIRDAMVVGHDHVDPEVRGRPDLDGARRPGVDREDERPACRTRLLDRPQRESVPVLEAARNVRRDVEPEVPQRRGEDGQPRQAVGIEVADHQDPLAAGPGPRRPRHDQLRVRQQGRVVDPRGRWPEERVELAQLHTPAREHPRQEDRPAVGRDPRRVGIVEGGAVRVAPAIPGGQHVGSIARTAHRRLCCRRRSAAAVTRRRGGSVAPWPRARGGERPAPPRRSGAGRR